MLNKIISLFRPEPSVAGVTAAFSKQVAALDTINPAKRNEAPACDAQIDAVRAPEGSPQGCQCGCPYRSPDRRVMFAWTSPTLSA